MKIISTVIFRQRGFTLIEVIATLTVAAIFAAMFASYMGSNLTGSVAPLIRVQNAYVVNSIMENMNADYKKLTYSDATPLPTFKTHVTNGNNQASTPYFGTYTLLYNNYVTFNGSDVETLGGTNVLKVTISVADQRATALFTK